jgi:hypothetical protein
MDIPRSFALDNISSDSSQSIRNYTRVFVGSSDEDSIYSNDSPSSTEPDENWIRTERRYNDHFQVHEFWLRKEWESTYERQPEYFARDVANICAQYEPGRITAIRLRGDLVDETTGGRVIKDFKIRLEYDVFKDDLEEMIYEFIQSNLAPMWITVQDFETSDTAVGKFVWYNLKFFDICLQTTPKTPLHATQIIGEGEIHPGVWVKRISTRDHRIEYGPKDCVIICLNEATGKRLKPHKVRSLIWPYSKSLDKQDFHRKKHLKALSHLYETGIILYMVDDHQQLIIGETFKSSVKLVKIGKVVGLLERFEKEPDTENYGTHSEGYFDLETVGEVQRVYAYSMKTLYWSSTITDDNIDNVEEELRNDIRTLLEKIPPEESLIMYSWNGSRFDSYIMLRILAADPIFKLYNLIINSGNELLTLSVKLGDNTGNIVFRDPCKLFPETLEGAANILGLGTKSQGVDHEEIEQAFLNNEQWARYLNENRDLVCEYVKQDVELLEDVVGGIRSLYCYKKEYALPLRNCLTRSMASTLLWMKMLPTNIRNQVLKLYIDPYMEIRVNGMRYVDIKDDAVGGRVQCVKRGEFDNVGAIDVISMYPYVASKFEYPCGDISFVKEYEPGKLGVYYVLIEKQSKPMVIPHREKRLDAYDWEYEEPFRKWVTSIDLEQIDEYIVIYGLVWSDKTKHFFDSYMQSLYNERKVATSKALNLHWKIFMNALTGSIFQDSFRDFTLILKREEFELTIKKYSEVVHVLAIEDLNENTVVIIFRPVKLSQGSPKIPMQEEFCKSAITSKPWILTMFIYAYARRVLREKWIEIENKGCTVLYCDTDSLIFTNCELVDLPPAKNMGDWEVEYWNTKACLHASKIYAVEDKIRIKGISLKSQSMICEEEADIPVFESFEEASEFFMEGRETSEKPGYKHVKALVEGKHVYFMNWQMQKSLTEGIIKRYKIIHIAGA